MLSFEVIILAIVAIINMMVVWVVASQGRKVVVNRYFAMTALFVIPWALGTALFFAATTQELARFGLMLFYIAPMFMILFMSFFAAIFPASRGSALTMPNLLLAFLTTIIATIIFNNQSILTRSIELNAERDFNNLLFVDPFWYVVYFAYFSFAFFIVFTEFYLAIRRSEGYRKGQLKYIFFGMLTAVSISSVTNLALPVTGMAQLIWLGPTSTLFAVLAITIAIIRHRLFDIKLAAVRSIAYIGVLLTLSVVYYLLAYIISVGILQVQTTQGVSLSPLNIILALSLTILFQPIKQFFDQVSDSIFYRDAYKSEEFFAKLSELLASTTDLRGLLERASQEISTTLKAEQSFFFLYYSNSTNHHLSAGTRHHTRLPLYDAETLKNYASSHKQAIFIEELLPDKDENIRRLLVSHRIAIFMPLRHRDRVIGYLCLGDRLSSDYTKRDLKVLTTISDELVIAIQNALSVHEVREINASLEQRIKVATVELRESNAQLHRLDTAKNEFVSMASHQLRTPLTSVKGYISMMLDGDVGKISDAQRNALQEAFNSSERMVRLIGDFLSVSRLQTGKFMIEKKPVDLIKVIEQEVDGLRIIASTHGQKLSFVHPKKGLVIAIDEAKIRQVIMNFIDNAIYYSRTNSSIHVSLSRLEKEIVFTVEDTGIGVPTEEQHKLFNKFYRATNARQQRPDGTGVGLFLAKKIITAHSGKIIFSSTVGQGSTFGFRVPLKQAEDQEDKDKK